MKTPVRKITRFYIINPVGDRRLEKRFDSREDVVVRFPSDGRVSPSVASEIGQNGLRLDLGGPVELGMELEVVFPNAPDHIRCFGRIVWARPADKPGNFDVGVSLEAWHGIVAGESSWMSYKGSSIRKDRRNRNR